MNSIDRLDQPTSRWQFNLRSMMLVTTVMAICMSLAVVWKAGTVVVFGAYLATFVFGDRRTRYAMVVLLLVFYLPYIWLFEGPHWGDYRWSWIKMYGTLPGLLPATLMFRRTSETAVPVVMTVITLLCFYGSLWLGRRGMIWLAATAVVILILSCANSYIEHILYCM